MQIDSPALAALNVVRRIEWKDPAAPEIVLDAVVISDFGGLGTLGFMDRTKDGDSIPELKVTCSVSFVPAGGSEPRWKQTVIERENPRWGCGELYCLLDWRQAADCPGTYRVEAVVDHQSKPGAVRVSVDIRVLGISFYHWGWFASTNWLATELPVLASLVDGRTHAFTPKERKIRSEMGYMVQGLVGMTSDGPEASNPMHHSLSLHGGLLYGPKEKGENIPGWRWPVSVAADNLRPLIEREKCELSGLTWTPTNCCESIGEELLRSLRYTREQYMEKLGCAPTSFTTHDSSLTPLLPQIARLVGYDTYVVIENWWAHQYHFNRSEGYFDNPEGTSLRLLTTRHIQGTAPGVDSAVDHAIENDLPAVLVMEEFACNVPTRYLRHFHRQQLAETKDVILLPVSLAEYARLTEPLAGTHRTTSDAQLAYKGWTGGIQDVIAIKEALRPASFRLAALEALAALDPALPDMTERWKGYWRTIIERNECHLHWMGQGWERVNEARELLAEIDSATMEVAQKIANDVDSSPDSLVIVNPLGWARGGEVRVDGGIESLTLADGRTVPTQVIDGETIAYIPEVPSLGWTSVAVSAESTAVTSTPAETADFGCDFGAFYVQADDKASAGPLQEKGELNVGRFSVADMAVQRTESGPVADITVYQGHLPGHPDVTLRLQMTRWHAAPRLDLEWSIDSPRVLPIGDRLGGGSQEAPYVPALFASFPCGGGTLVADKAYCVTEDPITSTYFGHQYRSLKDWGGQLFNALSMVRESGSDFSILTQGLGDFFLFTDENGNRRIGVSFGTGRNALFYHGGALPDDPKAAIREGITTHRVTVLWDNQTDETLARVAAWKAARECSVPLVACKTVGRGTRRPTDSLASVVSGEAVIAGADRDEDQVRMRLLNLSAADAEAELACSDSAASGAVTLPARAIREYNVRRATP